MDNFSARISAVSVFRPRRFFTLGSSPQRSASYTTPTLRDRVFTLLLIPLLFSGLQSCANSGERPQRDPAAVNLDEGPAVFGKFGAAPGDATGDPSKAPEGATWTIVLATFRGQGHAAAAAAALPKIRAYSGLTAAFVETRGQDASLVGLGRFVEPGSSAALAELRRVRAIAGSGTDGAGAKPFEGAFFAPPAGAAAGASGARPEYNLTRAREQHGKGAFVTLQVGVYERTDLGATSAQDLAEIRAAAEQAAAQLRREGEEAYYYHGPRRSMVTIGAFPEEDVTQKRSPAAAALRKRHPYNLLNGQGYKSGSSGQVRASEFVRVP